MADKSIHDKLDRISDDTAAIKQHLKDLNGTVQRHEASIEGINTRCSKQTENFREWKGATNVKIAVLSLASGIVGGLASTLGKLFN